MPIRLGGLVSNLTKGDKMTDESIMSMLYRILGELADIRELISEKNNQGIEKSDLMTLSQSAEYMKMTDNNFRAYAKRYSIPFQKKNGVLFFKTSDILDAYKIYTVSKRRRPFTNVDFDELQEREDNCFLSVYESAKYLSLSSASLYSLRKKNIVPSKKMGNLVFFLKSDLDKYLSR